MNPQPLRCAISDRNLVSGQKDNTALLRQAAWLRDQGVELVQLREKDLSSGELASLARSLLQALAGSSTKLLINGRVDVAVAVGAAGVHLTSSPDELTAHQVHQLYAKAGLASPVVTLSCHTVEEVVDHRWQPLSAMLFGPVFEKSVRGEHRVDGTGLTRLREACSAAAPIPVLALGGVTAANTEACLKAGARGVAGIRLFAQPA